MTIGKTDAAVITLLPGLHAGGPSHIVDMNDLTLTATPGSVIMTSSSRILEVKNRPALLALFLLLMLWIDSFDLQTILMTAGDKLKCKDHRHSFR